MQKGFALIWWGVIGEKSMRRLLRKFRDSATKTLTMLMPAAQQEYFADLIARLVGGRNQKIDCHLQTQWPPRRRVIGLALCAVRLKESLGHGIHMTGYIIRKRLHHCFTSRGSGVRIPSAKVPSAKLPLKGGSR